MKLKFVWVGVICATLAAAPLFAKELKSVSGLDWFQMYPEDRLKSIEQSMAILKKNRVKFSRTADEYTGEVYTLLLRNIDLYPVPITRVLVDYIHDSEPETGPAIESLISAEKI